MTRATALCVWRRKFHRKRSLNTIIVIIGLCMLVKLHTFSHYVQQEAGDKTLPMTSILHQYSNYDNGSHVMGDLFCSAYFDDRPIGIGQVFRIFGLESVNPEGDLYCNTRTMNWKSDLECSQNLTRVKRVPLGNEVHNLKACMYLCPATQSHGDVTVTLTRKPSCENSTNLSVRVTDGYNRTLDDVTSGFAVCVSAVLGERASFQMQDLIEFVEISRILGAKIIFLYSNQNSYIEELRYYTSKIEILKNMVQIIPWSVPAREPSGNAERILIMNDCLYRNLFKVKYIVFQTLQDILVPSKLWNWWELISSLRLLHNSSLVGAYVFSAVSYYDETATNTSMYRLETTDGNTKAYKLPKIVSHRVREKLRTPTLIDSGLIVEAKKIASIEPSTVPVMLPGFLYFPVPMEHGHLHRFLSRGRKQLKHLVVDSSTDRYVRPLLRSMHRHFYRRVG